MEWTMTNAGLARDVDGDDCGGGGRGDGGGGGGVVSEW